MPVKLSEKSGRVAIVTGAGGGLGRAYALYLAARGWRVVVNNRARVHDAHGRSSAECVVQEILSAGGIALAQNDDVCADGAGLRRVDAALQAWGRLDALVNNAGIDQHTTFHKITLEDFKHIFNSNFLGSLQITHAAYAHMRKAKHGRILVTVSTAGLHGLHGLSAYSASKAALIGLMRSIAAEGAGCDVLCNAIAPYAATRMTSAHMDPTILEGLSPDVVAPLVSALIAPESVINGQVWVVGGGWIRRAAAVEVGGGEPLGSDSINIMASLSRMVSMKIPSEIVKEFPNALEAYHDFLNSRGICLPDRSSFE